MPEIHDVFIYDHVRTPRGRGKADGALHSMSSVRLAAYVLQALQERNAYDPQFVEEVLLGCVDPVGEAGGDIARAAVFAAGYPSSVPGMQINSFCSSGLDAVNLAALQIASGQIELAVAGGVESMSRVGMGASGGAWPIDPLVALPSFFVPQGISADLIATKYGFSRTEVDAYAVESQRRAAQAWEQGHFERSVIPVRDVNGITLLAKDEHLRPDTTLETLAGLAPSFGIIGQMGGFDAVACQAHPEVDEINHVHHAGNSSGIVDGAAAVLVGSRAIGERLGLRPRARIRAVARLGSDPALMLTGPVDATRKLLAQTELRMEDFDVIEVNEAFSAVVLHYIRSFDLDPLRVNVDGGAIAMGHPLGATGAMILGTALDALERRAGRLALITLCVGSGMGIAMAIERGAE